MKLYRVIAPLLIGVSLLAACAAPTPGVVSPTVQVPPVDVPAVPTDIIPTPNDAPIQPPQSALAAQAALAAQLGVEPGDVTIAAIEEVQWTDSCLGAGGPAESCLQVITPGWRVTLTYQGEIFVYHTNADGTVLRLAQQLPAGSDGPTPAPNAGQPPTQSGEQAVLQAVVNALAVKLGVSAGTVRIVSVDQQEFSDSCLGYGRPDESCAQVITPGYALQLMAGSKTYEVHASLDGRAARLSDGTDLSIPRTMIDSVLVFRTGGQLCNEILASLTKVQSGPCGGPYESMQWPAPQRAQELEVLLQYYAPLEIQSPAGVLTLEGQGGRVPNALEEQSLVAWGARLLKELAAGKPNADAGQVLRYHRSGGIMGLCEDVIIYETGFAWNMSCKGDSPNITGVVRLNEKQLQQVDGWQQSLESFKLEQKDQATADGITTLLTFIGKGSSAASEAQKNEMMVLAMTVFRTRGPL